MDAPDDDTLMQRVQARDPEALRLLLERHLPALHRYLTRLSGSAADADELSQETFLRVWQAAGSYRPGRARLGTWLHRIAHNLHVDERRRQRAEPLPAELEPEDPAPGPESQAVQSRQNQELQQALMHLPETQRSALLLCQVQGLSTQEAAVVMGSSPRAVESLVARARRNLRRRLFAGAADHEAPGRQARKESSDADARTRQGPERGGRRNDA